MLSLAIKNIILMVVLILVLHFVLKNYLLDRSMMVQMPLVEVEPTPAPPAPIASIPKEDTQPPMQLAQAQPTSKVVVERSAKSPLAPTPSVPELFTENKEDPKSLDNLFKYILETSPPPTANAQPSNSDPLGFDQRMFANIQPFESEGDPLYQTWES